MCCFYYCMGLAGPPLAVLQVLDAGRQHPPLFSDSDNTLQTAKEKVKQQTNGKLDQHTRDQLRDA